MFSYHRTYGQTSERVGTVLCSSPAPLAVQWLDLAAAGAGGVHFAMFHASSELHTVARSAIYDCLVIIVNGQLANLAVNLSV